MISDREQPMLCENEECTVGLFYAQLVRHTEGAAPPYGPAGGLHYVWVVEDDTCPECGESGAEL